MYVRIEIKIRFFISYRDKIDEEKNLRWPTNY